MFHLTLVDFVCQCFLAIVVYGLKRRDEAELCLQLQQTFGQLDDAIFTHEFLFGLSKVHANTHSFLTLVFFYESLTSFPR